MAYLAAILLPILHGTANIIDGQLSSRKFKNALSLLFYCKTTSLFIVVFSPFLFGIPNIPNGNAILLIMFAGLLDLMASIPFLTAYKYADTSVVSAYLSLGKIFTPIIAFLVVGETILQHQYIGFIMIVFFSVILGIKDIRKFKINKGFYLMLFTAIIATIQTALLKKATSYLDPNSVNIYFNIVISILPFILLVIHKSRSHIKEAFPIYKNNIVIFIVLSLLDVSGWFASIYANSNLSMITVSAINSLRPFFILTVGILMQRLFKKTLNEKISSTELTKKIICFVFIILGVFISIGI